MSGKKLKVTLKGDAALKVTRGSDNVFRDLGLPNPEEDLAKAQLAIAIAGTIEERGLTQTAAAKRAGVSQPHISKIMGGRLEEFSCERLMTILNGLGKDIELVIRDAPRSRRHGRLIVAS